MRCSISNVSAAKAFQTVFYLHRKTYWSRDLSTQSFKKDTLKMRCQLLYQTAWICTLFYAQEVTSSLVADKVKAKAKGWPFYETNKTEWVYFRISSTFVSFKFVWLSVDRKTLSFRQLQMDTTCKDRLRDKSRSSLETNSVNKLKMCDNVL